MDKRTQGPRCAVMIHDPGDEQGMHRCSEQDKLVPMTVQTSEGQVVDILVCETHAAMAALDISDVLTGG